MLRAVLIAIGAAGLACGLASLAFGWFPPLYVLGFWGALLLLGTLCERVIYKRTLPARPGAGWQRTAERFIDDATGEPVTVYIEPVTGERAYVRE
jgi:hypothetical protein